jgi:hypothetical protein
MLARECSSAAHLMCVCGVEYMHEEGEGCKVWKFVVEVEVAVAEGKGEEGSKNKTREGKRFSRLLVFRDHFLSSTPNSDLPL